MIVLFPDHTRLRLEAMTIKIIESIALFGTYCIRLTNLHRSNRYDARVIENKQMIYVAKSKGHKQKAFQINDMEIRYDCAQLYHTLLMNYCNGILSRL